MTQALTLTLPDFLLARIAEREAVAKAAGGDRWHTLVPHGSDAVDLFGLLVSRDPDWQQSGDYVTQAGGEHGDDGLTPADAVHIALNDPAFVLAECAAHRRIVENELDDIREGSKPRRVDARRRLYLLAVPYVDHPDFRSEWTPGE